METLVILVTLAGLSAGGVWWWLSRPEAPSPRRVAEISWSSTGRPGNAEVDGDFFVLPPSDAPTPRMDRPPPALSIARIALAVAISTVFLVAVAWLVGLTVKVQLDNYFTTGG